MEIVTTIVLVSFVILLIYLLGTCLKQQEQIEDLKKQNKALGDSLITVHKFYDGELE